MTHYASMKSRFNELHFNAYDKEEYKKYIQWVNLKFKGSAFEVENHLLNEYIQLYIETLREDFYITPRLLNQISVKELYNIKNVCISIYNDHNKNCYDLYKPIPKKEIISNDDHIISIKEVI